MKHDPPRARARAPSRSGPARRTHFVAAALREMLRMGITTVRDVGSYGDQVVEARQAMRYGAFRGPRLLTCGRIVSATAPGGRFFAGMYREADGCDDVRRAVREQLRRGADFVKVMTTGARSVELEDPDPAQLTAGEIATLVEESHRMGYRVAAHAEGHRRHGARDRARHRHDRARDVPAPAPRAARPDGRDRPGARADAVLLLRRGRASTSRRASPPAETWSPLLVELAEYNLEQADLTLRAARAAGVRIAMGFDWAPLGENAIELVRMVRHGLTAHEALIAATATAADGARAGRARRDRRAGQARRPRRGRRRPARRPAVLLERDRIWLVLQLGEPVAGAALERELE